MATMTTAVDRITQVLHEQRQDRNNIVNPGGQEYRAENNQLEKFLRHEPGKFYGELDDEEAEKWLNRVEKIYAALRYTDEAQITYVVFLFEGDAEQWWNTVRLRWDSEDVPHLWDDFVSEFREKYISEMARERREDEFVNLKQGDMTVAQYEARFIKPSRYMPELVQPVRRMINRFVRGLRMDIQLHLTGQVYAKYSEAFQAASKFEKRKAEMIAESSQPSKKQYLGQSSQSQQRQSQTFVQVPQQHPYQPQYQIQGRPVVIRPQQGGLASTTV